MPIIVWTTYLYSETILRLWIKGCPDIILHWTWLRIYASVLLNSLNNYSPTMYNIMATWEKDCERHKINGPRYCIANDGKESHELLAWGTSWLLSLEPSPEVASNSLMHNSRSYHRASFTLFYRIERWQWCASLEVQLLMRTIERKIIYRLLYAHSFPTFDTYPYTNTLTRRVLVHGTNNIGNIAL
jgi:hypothetical protein